MRVMGGMALVLGMAAARGEAQSVTSSAEARSAEALRKAALAAVDSGEFATAAARTALYARAARLADSAVTLDPRSADGHFVRAVATGRAALAESPKERIRFAKIVRDASLAALQRDPDHAGANHVLGMWHAEVLRLNPVLRWAAKAFLGGQVFGTASWDDAERHLQRAVAREPDRITHRLDLAGVLADRGKQAEARAQYEWIARATPRDYNDRTYQRQAAQRLERP